MKNSKTKKTVLSALFTALLIISAQITVPGAVPFTMQTFAVALIGALFGAKRGALIVSSYILLGLIGIPVFSAFRAGGAVLFGATGGYITGFIFFVLITGVLSKRAHTAVTLVLSMAAGLIACYIFGTLWYAALCLKDFSEIPAAISACVLPFVLPDLVKIYLAALFCKKFKKFN